MKRLGYVHVLPLLTVLTWSGVAAQGTVLSDRSEATVRGLYEQVVARHPLGIPHGDDMEVLAPYISKTMLQRFEVNQACSADWFRQNPHSDMKPPGLFEDGIFSGTSEAAEPTAFLIESTDVEKDGSMRVRVRLSRQDPTTEPLIWHVAAAVVQEDGHPVVDDVIFLKDHDQDIELRLSEWLAAGCDGPRWIGYGD